MVKTIVLGVIFMFGLTSAAYSGHPLIQHHRQMKQARQAAVYLQSLPTYYHIMVCEEPGKSISARVPAETKLVKPLVYKPSEARPSVMVPRPYKRMPHIHDGRLYRNLHYGKINSRVHAKVVTLKPY